MVRVRPMVRTTVGRVRLWTTDNMNWVMAPKSVEVGSTVAWAGRVYKVVRAADGTRRVRECRGREA